MKTGDIHKSTLWGDVEIVEYINSKVVHAKFVESGNLITTQKHNIIKGLVRDSVRQTSERNQKIFIIKNEALESRLSKTKERLQKLELKNSEKELKKISKQEKLNFFKIQIGTKPPKRKLSDILTSSELSERRRKYAQEYYLVNRDSVLDSAKKWQRDNPEKTRIRNSRRRGRRKGAEGSHTLEEVEQILQNQNCKCTACGCDLDDKKHLDHIIPLALGGTNYANNLQWLCQFCNISKGAKHPDEWAKEILTQEFKARRQAATRF